MKAIMLILSVALFFTSCKKTTIRGSGATITETRAVTAFTGVRVEGTGKVKIVHGLTQKVEVTGFENLVPIYETNVTNNILTVKFKNDYYNVRNNNVSVSIVIPFLRNATINGTGEISFSDFIGGTITTEINGSGDIHTHNNYYDDAVLKINGSGFIRGAGIKATNADVEVNGSGKIEITCTDKLKATIHGSGEITYWGTPTQVVTNISGSGKVKRG